MNKNQIVKQSNALTASRSEFTALQRDIMYMVLSKMSNKDDDKNIYTFTLEDLSFKKGVRIQHDELEEAITPLVSKLITIPTKDNGWIKTTYASSAEFKRDISLVEIEISSKLKPYYFDLKNNYTLFNIDVAFKLKSKYAKKFYEIVSRFKDLGQKTFVISELKELLGIIQIDTKGNIKDKYTRYSLFKERILDRCMSEINEKTDLNISFGLPVKKGRKIHAISIYIKQENFQTAISFEDETAKIYDRLTKKFGLRKDQAVRVIKENDIQSINKMLYNINLNHNKKGSIGGYTAIRFGLTKSKYETGD